MLGMWRFLLKETELLSVYFCLWFFVYLSWSAIEMVCSRSLASLVSCN
jgi:hypothetical protein